MTDTDRLAALLHDAIRDVEWVACVHSPENEWLPYCEDAAARLRAAGVTLQPAAPAEGLAAAVHDVICTALADYDSHEPGDIRYLCDPAPFRASLERLEIQPAAPAEGLRERIAAFFRAYDSTHLVHDVAYEDVNDAVAALRAALTPEDDR